MKIMKMKHRMMTVGVSPLVSILLSPPLRLTATTKKFSPTTTTALSCQAKSWTGRTASAPLQFLNKLNGHSFVSSDPYSAQCHYYFTLLTVFKKNNLKLFSLSSFHTNLIILSLLFVTTQTSPLPLIVIYSLIFIFSNLS